MSEIWITTTLNDRGFARSINTIGPDKTLQTVEEFFDNLYALYQVMVLQYEPEYRGVNVNEPDSTSVRFIEADALSETASIVLEGVFTPEQLNAMQKEVMGQIGPVLPSQLLSIHWEEIND